MSSKSLGEICEDSYENGATILVIARTVQYILNNFDSNQVLHNPDDCQLFNDLVEFKENFLDKNCEELKQYDSVGEDIIFSLIIDKNNKVIAEIIIQKYLLKIQRYYKECKYDEAYNRYYQMIKDLMNHYNITLDKNKVIKKNLINKSLLQF